MRQVRTSHVCCKGHRPCCNHNSDQGGHKASFEIGLPKVWNRLMISSQWDSHYLTCWFCFWPKHAFFSFSLPFLFLFLFVWCMCVYMFVHMNINVKARGPYWVSSSVILSFIFKTGSHWTWRSLIWLDYRVSWLCICPSTGVTPSFMWVGSRDLNVGPRAYAASSHWTSPAALLVRGSDSGCAMQLSRAVVGRSTDSHRESKGHQNPVVETYTFVLFTLLVF